ncbi:MAG: hypothetical protein ACHP7J_03980 [Terriglobales bacterium]
MAKARMKQAVIPKFSSEAEEAAWWDAHRSEIDEQIRQRIATEINERAAKMTAEERAQADSETKKIAARVQRRTPSTKANFD